MSLASSLSVWVSLSASHTQGFTATPIVSVVQKSVKSIGEAYLTCNMLVTSLISSGFPPKTTHPSGDLRASRWSTCLVSSACICAWSMPISRSTCPFPRRNLVFGTPRTSGKCDVFTAGILSLMLWMPIALIVKRLLLSIQVSWTLYSFVFIFSKKC